MVRLSYSESKSEYCVSIACYFGMQFSFSYVRTHLYGMQTAHFAFTASNEHIAAAHNSIEVELKNSDISWMF